MEIRLDFENSSDAWLHPKSFRDFKSYIKECLSIVDFLSGLIKNGQRPDCGSCAFDCTLFVLSTKQATTKGKIQRTSENNLILGYLLKKERFHKTIFLNSSSPILSMNREARSFFRAFPS
jgi:hypothetical protein